MPLRTNSKQARENIRKFIVENFNYEQFLDDTGENLEHDFEVVKRVILDTFNKAKYYSDSYAVSRGIRPAVVFHDWVTGLPLYFIADDIVLGNANETLGAILNQTESEREKFSEMDSMNLLIDLIYRELTR